ncbi:ATP-grasp domain-containing protein [Kitasatospora phosalacinea]|uniref:ATP-grasp domain-containing protein n=1 Tax=Kitasatospora phosalacinea TaxID=2065 RepID=A0A9W6UTK9_9ACTN|nr:hypothetical protein [Kitasatospora phosalacinea]GLW58710.1 hypothetical protein Kpho01_67210 [Kitasatospora phosalacinea]
MRILVLSTGNPVLENALAADGHTVFLLQPVGTGNADDPNRYTITHWDNLDALAEMEPWLPHLDAVATIDEQAIVAAAYLRELRGLPGLSLEAAVRYTDKAVMKTALAAADLQVAPHRVVHRAEQIPEFAEEFGWPVVVKPRASLASVNTLVVNDEQHLQELLDQGAFDTRATDPTGRFTAGHVLDSLHEAEDGFLVEKYLDLAAEHFVDLYVYRGDVLLAVPGRYNAPLLTTLYGTTRSYDTVLRPDLPVPRHLVHLARQAAAALGQQTGVVHCEILETRDYPFYFIGEVAARPGGGAITELASRMYAFDLPQTLADLACDRFPTFRTTARFMALTAAMITAPPGRVVHIADRATIEALPGVLDADIRLSAGEAVPEGIGTMTTAGRILYGSCDNDVVDGEVEDLYTALDLRVDEDVPAART